MQSDKIREGYANFAIADPPLKLILFTGMGKPGSQPRRRRGSNDRLKDPLRIAYSSSNLNNDDRGRRMTMPNDLLVDVDTLRTQVRDKYRDVAVDPHGVHHFHTGRPLAARLGYDRATVDSLPDRAVESFAGVGNPFSLRSLQAGERVVDIGSGAGFDSFIAATQVGPTGRVIGIDMTPEMLAKSRDTAYQLEFAHVEFREGLAEATPVEDGWADVVISNGVINLCADKQAVFAEIFRVLRPGGVLQFADIANGRPVPVEAMRDVDLWTG